MGKFMDELRAEKAADEARKQEEARLKAEAELMRHKLLNHEIRVPGNWGEDCSYKTICEFKENYVDKYLTDLDERYRYYHEEKEMYLKEKAKRDAAREKAEKEAEEARLAIPAPTVESIETHKRTMAMARHMGLIT